MEHPILDGVSGCLNKKKFKILILELELKMLIF